MTWDCDTLAPYLIALLVIIALLGVLWVYREVRPLFDGYACGNRVYSGQNQVTYVGTPPCADRVRAQPGCKENFSLIRRSNFFPSSGTTFFGADSTMTSVSDPGECQRIGLRPEFMMIQDGKPVYRCVRTGQILV